MPFLAPFLSDAPAELLQPFRKRTKAQNYTLVVQLLVVGFDFVDNELAEFGTGVYAQHPLCQRGFGHARNKDLTCTRRLFSARLRCDAAPSARFLGAAVHSEVAKLRRGDLNDQLCPPGCLCFDGTSRKKDAPEKVSRERYETR